MQDLLMQFALRDVWCDPYQDKQTVIRLARITKKGGGFKTAPVIRQQVKLPNFSDTTDKATYHLYQIGQLPPHLFNMLTIPEDSRYARRITTVASGFVAAVDVDGNKLNVDVDGYSPDANGFVRKPGDLNHDRVIDASDAYVDKAFVIIQTGQWYRVAQLCVANSAVIDIYTANGTRLPLHECWLQRTSDRNFILAVRVMPNYDLGVKQITDLLSGETSTIRRTLDNESLYIRFYSNSLFDNHKWRTETADSVMPIRVLVSPIATLADWTIHSQSMLSIETTFGMEGRPIYRTDGYITHRPTGFNNDMVGKVLTYTWDASIKEITYFPLVGLPTFVSDVDAGKTKYALIRNTPNVTIDFYDDVDFYLIRRLTTTQYKGVYVGKVRNIPVRQLTNSAYALSKDAIDALITADPLFSTGVLEIMVVVRQGGLVRGLQQQHTRIEELSRLTYLQIVEAMTSVDNTTVPEWNVRNLEKDTYVTLMGKSATRITREMVEDVFGYNTATRLVANPLCHVEPLGGDPIIKVPLAACVAEADNTSAHRAIFCYNDTGEYLGYFTNRGNYTTTAIVAPFKQDTVLTECFNMRTSTNDTSLYFGQDVQSLDLAHWGFRCYVCPVVGGIPNEEWEDITNTVYYTYTSDNGIPEIRWNYDILTEDNLFGCVRIGGHMQVNTLPTIAIDRAHYDGYIHFQIESEMEWLGNVVTRPQSVAAGIIDVFMDGRSLHQGLDFYVKWPHVVIVKKPTTAVNVTNVRYRVYGFADKATMQPIAPRELEFVRGGILSVNGNYDIRNDRNIRVIVDGLLVDRDTVSFSESDTLRRVTDGRPYSVSDYMLSVEPYTTKITNEYRDKSIDMDNRVSDYLESRLPTYHPNFPIVDTQQWDLVSPFCSAILHAIDHGDLVIGTGVYTDSQIDAMVTPWKWLLDYDPCTQGVDSNYVYVHPHQFETMSLLMRQYRFVERVIVLYLNNLPDLTPSVVIGG